MTSLTLQTEVKRSETHLSENLGEEIVLLSIEKGHYYSLDDIGSAVWDIIAEPTSISSICSQLQAKYDVTQSQCEADVLTYLGELAAESIIEITSN